MTSDIDSPIRNVTSYPVHTLQMISSKPGMIATTGIIFGRTRSMSPSTMTGCNSAALDSARRVATLFSRCFKRFVQVDQHDHTCSAPSASNCQAWGCGLLANNQVRTDSFIAPSTESVDATRARVGGEC